jgi:hypothetical protein
VSAAKFAGKDVSALAGSSPSAVFVNGAETDEPELDCLPRAYSTGEPGGNAAIAASMFCSNSSEVMLLRPEASIVSINDIAPVFSLFKFEKA